MNTRTHLKNIFFMHFISFFFLSVFFNSSLIAQITIEFANASEFPESVQNSMYVAGNFNDWNPGDAAYHLKEINGIWQVTFTPDKSINAIEFKFTRGTWETGEVLKDGGHKENRTYYYKPGLVLKETVEDFQDRTPQKIAEANTNVIQFKIYSPELKREKNIRVYLPCDYTESPANIAVEKHFPVLYMLDGQNLFDETISFNGEWGIDESMDSICKMEKMQTSIIVGIDHADGERINEYSPWTINEKYGGGDGDVFADFLVQTLKPKIDSMYRTLQGRESTGIAGSSVAGTESLYIVLHYPDYFSMAGIFSPSLWTSNEFYKMADAFNYDAPVKIYFVAGATEGGDTQTMNDMEKMYNSLLDNKIQNLKMRLIIESSGIHTEAFWNSEFLDCYEWLYGE